MGKKIITIVLLAVVVGSIGFVLIKELGEPKDAATEEPLAKPGENKVIVMYIYFGPRCVTCRKFEAYTQEAVAGLEKSPTEVQWLPINADQPGNEHYRKDYDLITKSVILQRVVDGRPTNWVNLKEIWNHVQDKAAFIDYIRKEINAFLKENPS